MYEGEGKSGNALQRRSWGLYDCSTRWKRTPIAVTRPPGEKGENGKHAETYAELCMVSVALIWLKQRN